jgi:hypothetical protein
VAGALALLLGAYPSLTVDQQQAALLNAAVDLGAIGGDNTFGYGRLDILAAYQWLQGGGSPTPTPTPVPPTPTPVPPTLALHIGDLDGATNTTKSGWTATITIAVHASDHSPVSGVTVTGGWSDGYSGTSSCMTDGSGRCQVTTGSISKKKGSVDFGVSSAARAGYTYEPSSNHDPDADSNGTTITVIKP